MVSKAKQTWGVIWRLLLVVLAVLFAVYFVSSCNAINTSRLVDSSQLVSSVYKSKYFSPVSIEFLSDTTLFFEDDSTFEELPYSAVEGILTFEVAGSKKTINTLSVDELFFRNKLLILYRVSSGVSSND
jgi:hypothetical protein